jgi:hypothetical protein
VARIDVRRLTTEQALESRLAAEGLVSPDQARLVKANDDGSPSVTDGPFAETRELIAGYWIVEAKMRMKRTASRPAYPRAPVLVGSR